MPVSRYRNRGIFTNNDSRYNDIFTSRDVRYINQYSFDKFKNLKLGDIPDLQVQPHTWSSSDRFYKLAGQYYGDSTYWWVIALFNNIPLETDVALGQQLLIPLPLTVIINALGV